MPYDLRTRASGFWTDAKIARLCELWPSAMSCSEIATDLGTSSRHVVIGKAHRLGLGEKGSAQGARSTIANHYQIWTDAEDNELRILCASGRSIVGIAAAIGRSSSSVGHRRDKLGLIATPRTAAPAPPRSVTNRIAPRPIVHAAPCEPPPGAVLGVVDAMLALQLGECKWPHSDATAPDFRFCAATAESGRAYCEFHRLRASGAGTAWERQANQI